MQLIEHEHGFEIDNFSLLLQVIRGNSVVTVEVLEIQVFKCKLTINLLLCDLTNVNME